ncbi:MAG: homogentisate 1,2-dioxygenase, partial [Chloroflexi bacterium]|nr:homogentisate 1,2-dioxygenase [Chloroflexota bacterium]
MPPYHRLGSIPHKRHTQFRRPDGGLFHEELFGTEGFAGPYSLLYHFNPPPRVSRIERRADLTPQPWRPEGEVHRVHLLKTRAAAAGGDAVTARTPLLFNDDVTLAVASPAQSMDYYYRNGDGDELLFVHEGRGRLESVFGQIAFGPGDYLVIPRGTTYRITLEEGGCRLLVIEARGGPIEPPARYRNAAGQLMEHAPYHERDLRLPTELETHSDGEGREHEVWVKVGGVLYAYVYDFHPLDVAGWDGQLYPWAFSIHDFEPITGRIHQPPTVHQTFQGPQFVVCSFVPRKLDYHPQAVPVPYNHSNID